MYGSVRGAVSNDRPYRDREIIRDLNETASLRKKDIEQILFDVIDDEGGPLIYGVSSKQQQRSFDSTCRKFHRFLGQHPRSTRQSPTDSPDEARLLSGVRDSCMNSK